ncbi:MAG: hypothetical protein LBR89_04195 [Holosporales bacterium]|jgi:F-type H+-transporting ATPase subunit b|nr:hypothetical protein [Holosporales bacterium]
MKIPQVDTSTYTSQIFWLLLCALVLLFFVKNVFIPRLLSIMDARDKRVLGDTARAQGIRASTQKLQTEYDEKIAENRDSAVQQQQAKLAEFDTIKEEQLAQMQKIFTRKRLALEKKSSLDLRVDRSFVDILLKP